jgi:hypothetical protein
VTLHVALLILAAGELGAKVLFRWRTWRDRGVIALGATLITAVVLWTEPAQAFHRLLSAFLHMPGGSVLLPALALLLGLVGMNPFLFALFLGVAHPDFSLSASITLPMALGNLPMTAFLLWTMPPQAGERVGRKSAGES